MGSGRVRANRAIWRVGLRWPAPDPVGWGAWDGLRGLRLGGGDGAAGVHRPGLPSVSLQGLRQAVQRVQSRPAERVQHLSDVIVLVVP